MGGVWGGGGRVVGWEVGGGGGVSRGGCLGLGWVWGGGGWGWGGGVSGGMGLQCKVCPVKREGQFSRPGGFERTMRNEFMREGEGQERLSNVLKKRGRGVARVPLRLRVVHGLVDGRLVRWTTQGE